MTRQGFKFHDDFIFGKKLNEKGQLVCVNCGEILKGHWKRWCSEKCKMDYYVKHTSNWNTIKERALKRDNFTCRICGRKVAKYPDVSYNSDNMAIGDHIVPIWKGGAEFDVNNVQTLCYVCSKEKTMIEAHERTKMGELIRKGVQRQLSYNNEKL